MSHFDVFNGDADGLCALQQLRLAMPRPARLITGVKRDNALLARVCAEPGDSVSVLDIALSHNRPALMHLLAQGVAVEYFDHHHAPEIPEHPLLHLVIDASPSVCTSVLVDRHLHGRHRSWAVVGAFGDNLSATARELGAALPADTLERLRRLGECLNYNGYGDTESDLLYPPADLHGLLLPYGDPLDFIANEPAVARIAAQRDDDMARALAVPARLETATAAVFALPDAAWSRRVVGSFANRLAAGLPPRAFAILVPNRRGSLTVSLRAPPSAAVSADAFARRYGGDGRRLAAGIDDLPPPTAEAFAADFVGAFAG